MYTRLNVDNTKKLTSAFDGNAVYCSLTDFANMFLDLWGLERTEWWSTLDELAHLTWLVIRFWEFFLDAFHSRGLHVNLLLLGVLLAQFQVVVVSRHVVSVHHRPMLNFPYSMACAAGFSDLEVAKVPFGDRKVWISTDCITGIRVIPEAQRVKMNHFHEPIWASR